jgi:hypothetical protein
LSATPAKFPTFRHDWLNGKERRIPACESADGCDRTEKTCAACGMIKVTIHYPENAIPGREWIMASGDTWVGTSTPPCVRTAPSEVKA